MGSRFRCGAFQGLRFRLGSVKCEPRQESVARDDTGFEVAVMLAKSTTSGVPVGKCRQEDL